MFVAVFNLLHNKGIRGNLQLLGIWGLIRRKLNRWACHHRRRTFCLLEFWHDECTRKTSPYDPCGPVSSSFTVMLRLLPSNRNIGPFVSMFLVFRLCFLWRNTGLYRAWGGGGGSRTTERFLGCPKRFGHFGLSGGNAGTPSCYFLWLFCSLVFSRLRNWVRSCWVRQSFHLFRHLLVLHRLLSEGIDVQIGSASLRWAVPGTCHNGGRARR